MHHDGLKAYREPKIPDFLSKGSASKETELAELKKILLQIPVRAMPRPKRVVRPPARKQDYQLDKFLNVLPLVNIISFECKDIVLFTQSYLLYLQYKRNLQINDSKHTYNTNIFYPVINILHCLI